MIIYLAIALGGVLLLLISFVVGELFEFLDFDFGDVDGDGPGTTSVIAVGLTAFGAGGMLATNAGWGTGISVLTAATSAIALGALGAWLISYLYSGSAGTDSSLDYLQGRVGEVTTTISANSPGEVLMTTHHATRQTLARSATGQAIPSGTLVRVVNVIGNTLVVEPANLQDAGAGSEQKMEA
jgi:membrane protein implicated in regulation of membrane protease activity